jgi:hypothetical protein
MPEPPDFEQIARDLLQNADGREISTVAESLRQVWNARGAADVDAIEDQIRRSNDVVEGIVVPPPPTKFLRAIRKLDR